MSIFTKLSSLRNKRSASSSSLNQGSVGDLQPSAKHKRTSAIDPRLVAAKALLDTMKAPYTNYFFKSTSTLESNSDRYSQYFLYFGPFVAIYLLDTFPSVSADLSVYMPGVLGPEKQGWSPIKTSSEKDIKEISLSQFIKKTREVAISFLDQTTVLKPKLRKMQTMYILKQISIIIYSTMYQRVATNPDHALEYKNLIMLLHFLERRQSLKKQSHRLFSDKLERILSKFDSIQITLDKVDENQSPISKFARLLCRNYIKSFTIAPQETIIKLPPIEIIFAFDNNRVSDLNVPIEADLLEAIESCIEFLTSPNRPKSEIQASNEWLRKSVQKTEIANITSLGINKWIETFKREPDCCLVASMLKGLIRRIPNGLIPKGVQELLMFFMSSTVIVEKETVLDIQALFGIEQSRFGVLVQVGELARYIFKNAETSILPVSLSIVVPVDENLVKEVVEGSLLKAEKAKETISTSMEYFDRWNSAFGSVLANSDMFFENGFEFIEIAKSAQV